MGYEWFIAKRYLRPEGGATFIFHLTLFSIGAVGLGVTALITVLSVMNGFGNDVRSKIIDASSHMRIQFPHGTDFHPSIIEEYNQIPNVAAGSPVVRCEGLLFATDYPGMKIPVMAYGIDPEYERAVTQLDQKMLFGDLDALRDRRETRMEGMVDITALQSSEMPGIIIGKELAANLFGIYPDKETGAQNDYGLLGSRISLITLPTDDLSMAYTKPEIKHFRVVGVFSTGYYEYDLTWVYIPMKDAQYLTGMPGKMTELQIRLEKPDEASTLATQKRVHEKNQEQKNFGYTKTWMSMNQVFFEALKIEKFAMDIILKIIILVATFNIIATIFMIVMAKTRDIGLLRAIGSSRRSVMTVFLLLGIYIGVIGTVLGIAGGYGLCTIIQLFPIELPGNGQVYNLRYLPCDMQVMDFAGVSVYTFIISFLAAIYPAVRASNLHPVEALRYD